jgi:HEAT repeat protein
LVFAAAGHRALAADASADKEAGLIRIIQSNVPPQDKAIPCKELAIYGTAKAVPALAALLPDKDLSSWARTALEAIPDQAADEALRQAIGKLKGRLLIGVVNSIGVRAYAKATDDLAGLLKDSDEEVASAAAAALGRIGTAQAAKAIEPCLTGGPAGVRSAAAEGCVMCAEKLLAAGQADEAIRLYDTVRKADVPAQRIIEATRGAVLARKDAGAPMLTELLRSKDRAMFGLGLRLARELPGQAASDVISAEFASASPDRQGAILLALASRGNLKATPAVIEAAKSGKGQVRVVALGILQNSGDVSCVPVLLDAAVDDDAEVSQTARLTLARLPGQAVSADIVARMEKAEGKLLPVLVDLAGQRQIPEAIPAMVRLAGGTDAGARTAALGAIAVMGTDKQIPDVLKLVQKAQGPDERAGAEKALTALSGRTGAACVSLVKPLMQSTSGELRIVGLHTMIAAGGPEALAAVKAAIDDKDEAVQDEAVRTLSTWPNKWPQDQAAADMLLALAKAAKKVPHQVLAMRGYLQYLQSSKKLSDAQRLAKASEALQLAARPEEKRLVIAVLASIVSNGSVEMLTKLASEPQTAQEACLAIVNLAGEPGAKKLDKAVLKKALETASQKTKSDGAKKKANAAMKGL